MQSCYKEIKSFLENDDFFHRSLIKCIFIWIRLFLINVKQINWRKMWRFWHRVSEIEIHLQSNSWWHSFLDWTPFSMAEKEWIGIKKQQQYLNVWSEEISWHERLKQSKKLMNWQKKKQKKKKRTSTKNTIKKHEKFTIIWILIRSYSFFSLHFDYTTWRFGVSYKCLRHFHQILFFQLIIIFRVGFFLLSLSLCLSHPITIRQSNWISKSFHQLK